MHDGRQVYLILKGLARQKKQFVEDEVRAETALVDPLHDLILNVD